MAWKVSESADGRSTTVARSAQEPSLWVWNLYDRHGRVVECGIVGTRKEAKRAARSYLRCPRCSMKEDR